MSHLHRFWFVVNHVRCACGLTLPACPVRSSITDAPCILPDGHACDSPTRFHRYPVQP